MAAVFIATSVCSIHALVDLPAGLSDMLLLEAEGAVADDHVDQRFKIQLRNKKS